MSGTSRCACLSLSATAAAPSGPVTAIDQPASACARASGIVVVWPTTVSDRTAGPSVELMSPPAIASLRPLARPAMPPYRFVSWSTVQRFGIGTDVKAHRDQLRQVFLVDAADREDRNGGQRLRDRHDALRTDDLLFALYGRGEGRPASDVVRPILDRPTGGVDCGGGRADEKLVARDPARRCDRDVIRSEVHAVSAAEHCDIDVIVDDEQPVAN